MANWDDTPSADWNDSETPTISWADEPTADEPNDHFAELSSYEVLEPPSEPTADGSGRTTGTVKVSLRHHLLYVGTAVSLHAC